ncbi:MAG: nicotinate-nucleotide--dimethylbenzimidazole phosphoribosyltransferase [Motiliproteus sp.]
MQLNWWSAPVKTLHAEVRAQAEERQLQLTKPPGALGKLEQLAIDLASMQGRERPQLDSIYVSIFAGDHGIAEEGVSAFPQAVTAEMIRNFSNGGAAICVLAQRCQASFEVVNLGTVVELGDMPAVIDARIAPSTANFSREPAMSETQLERAMQAGADAAERAAESGAQLFVGGEMGIANTTSASAIAAALLQLEADFLTGPGTGVDAKGVQHKAEVITAALAFHHCGRQFELRPPLEVLRRLGGFEIAALAAAYIRCAQLGVTVLVDGFISTVAALVATTINAETAGWLLYSHGSAEPGHRRVLAALGAEPLVNLNMRLGEGSGAALVVPLLQSACALHNQMATFAEAAVSAKQ